MKRRLLVLRHAKSDWGGQSPTDHARPLNKRGLRAAAHIGKVLRAERFRPQLVITSSANRALSTAQIVAERAGVEAPLVVRDELYSAGADGWLELVRETSEEIDSLLVVGHEPTCSGVVQALAGVSTIYPTAGLAGLAIDTRWGELGSVRCQLELFLVPRLLAPVLDD